MSDINGILLMRVMYSLSVAFIFKVILQIFIDISYLYTVIFWISLFGISYIFISSEKLIEYINRVGGDSFEKIYDEYHLCFFIISSIQIIFASFLLFNGYRDFTSLKSFLFFSTVFSFLIYVAYIIKKYKVKFFYKLCWKDKKVTI